MINRFNFFNTIRPIFGGSLSSKQVQGMSEILTAYEKKYPTLSLHSVAYILATAFHETARTMQPIEEYGKGRGREYGTHKRMDGKSYDLPHLYYGRGFVQLTWYENYEKAGKILGVDLLNHPQLALNMEIAVNIMFEGMIAGWFTGRRLSHYFGEKNDLIGARKIINGRDKAELIAGYAQVFYNGLK